MAASVLPTPVGAINKTFFLEFITGQVDDCARVGSDSPRLSRAASNLGLIFIAVDQLSSLILQILILPESLLVPSINLLNRFSK